MTHRVTIPSWAVADELHPDEWRLDRRRPDSQRGDIDEFERVVREIVRRARMRAAVIAAGLEE
jgi:hypothetical protein